MLFERLHFGVKLVLVAFIGLVLGMMAAIMVAGVAQATTTAPVPAAPVSVSTLTPQMVSGLIGALVPLLVSLLARYNASEKVKVFINLALTAVTGALAALVVIDPATGQATFGWVPFLTSWLFAFVTSTIAYLGALKHLDVNALLLSLGGIFGQKNPAGSGVAGVTMIIAGEEVQVQDSDATIADQYPAIERDPADLDDPVEGVDQ